MRGGALIAKAAAGASHLLLILFSATRAYVKGSVRCAIPESLHGIRPMRCSCSALKVHVPRGWWLEVPGSSQEMAGKCSSKRFLGAESEDVHCADCGVERTLEVGGHHRGDSTKKSLAYSTTASKPIHIHTYHSTPSHTHGLDQDPCHTPRVHVQDITTIPQCRSPMLPQRTLPAPQSSHRESWRLCLHQQEMLL